jgi:hypothetical protein
MRKHLMKCTIINSSAERQQQRTTFLAQVDAAKNLASQSQPSTSTSRSFTQMPPPPHQSTPFSQFPPYNSYHSPSPSSAPPLSPLFPFEGLQSFPPGSPFSPPNDLESPSLFEYSHKRRRTSTTSSHVPTWSGEQQQEFNEDLCKLFATCGWSWNAVNSPELKLFFGKYLPQAVLPDRRVLSGSILEGEAAKFIARARQETNGKLATYSEDGWTNVSRTHVDTSIISVEATVSNLFVLRNQYM